MIRSPWSKGPFTNVDHPLKLCGIDDSYLVYGEFDDERTENFRDRLVYRETIINEDKFWYADAGQRPEFTPSD